MDFSCSLKENSGLPVAGNNLVVNWFELLVP